MLLGYLQACGVPAQSGQIGGIVDNGNRPSDPEEKKQGKDSAPSSETPSPENSPSPANSVAPSVSFAILDRQYQVALPGEFIPSIQTAEQAQFKFSGKMVLEFTNGSVLCSGASYVETTSAHFVRYQCEAGVLDVITPSGKIIHIVHALTSMQIKSVVNSLKIVTEAAKN